MFRFNPSRITLVGILSYLYYFGPKYNDRLYIIIE